MPINIGMKLNELDRILDDPTYAESELRKAFEEERSIEFKFDFIRAAVRQCKFTINEAVELWSEAVQHCERKLMREFIVGFEHSPYFKLFAAGPQSQEMT